MNSNGDRSHKPMKAVCVCGNPIRRHSYKGWYHPDGQGKGHRDHSPQPRPDVDPAKACCAALEADR